jgi:UDP-N-acetylmuramyl pentapeptide phosphotransferase/UDP-N-acetylglucosamine-1-phosphate transferase
MLSIMLTVIAALCITVLLTKTALPLLRLLAVFDVPNARSSHQQPTLRGGGVAIVDTTLICMLVLTLFVTHELPHLWPILLSFFALALLSFYDDMRPLPARLRLSCHSLAVAFSLYFMAPETLLFQGVLPLWYDRLITLLLWVWCINLYNFMDGIDGLTGSQTLIMASAILLVTFPLPISLYMAVMIGVSIGFLLFNWPPARLFLGDVGSISLGYFMGFALLQLAFMGHPLSSLIIAGYYLTDSSLTLCIRLCTGQALMSAHKDHFYQQALRKGWSHQRVLMHIIITNLCLSMLALAHFHHLLPTTLTIIAALLIITVTLTRLHCRTAHPV